MDLLENLKIEDLNIIGQSADKAVIFCYHLKKRRILCFDQHAASERIRYESLLDAVDFVHDIDLLKSRACHGAIRFGDKLSLSQCQDLIQKLLTCKVPFKCAHSRCGVSVLENLDKILFLEKVRRNMSKKRSQTTSK